MEGVEAADLRGEEVGRDSRGRSYYVFPQFYEDCRVFRTAASGGAGVTKGGRKGSTEEKGEGKGEEGKKNEEGEGGGGGEGQEEAKGESPAADPAGASEPSHLQSQDPPFSVLPRFRKERTPVGGMLECAADSLPSLLALVAKLNKSRWRADGELSEMLGAIAQGVMEELEKRAAKEEGLRRREEKARLLEQLPRRRSRRLGEGEGEEENRRRGGGGEEDGEKRLGGKRVDEEGRNREGGRDEGGRKEEGDMYF